MAKRHKGRKHSVKGRYRSSTSVVEYAVHPLVIATKQAQTWAKIVDAIPDEEIKQLALAEYRKLGEKL